MVIRDMDLQPDALCYIGAIKGSGFFWIGHRKDVPEQYLDAPIAETDRRTVDAPGTIILLEGDCKEFFGGKEPPGYWYWYECDPSAPKPVEGRMHGSPAHFENLLVGIAKTEGYWYKNKLRKALDSVHHDMDRAEAEELVRNVQTVCRPHLVILPESSVGQYIIQRIEDEAVARGICPRAKWARMKFEARHQYLDMTVKKFVQERVRKDDYKHYATIKGRSVKHMTLFEINEQIQKAIELGFDPETGEILDASALEQLQMDRDEKIENICLYIKDLVAESKALADEAKALTERKERSVRKAESLKNYLQAMLAGQKWKSSKAAVSYRKTQAVVIDDINALKPEFLRVKTEPDKVAIKDVLKAGAAVAGAHLEDRQSMSIK